jgi:hypothetical protein
MKGCLNGREGAINKWRQLFKTSNKRFRFRFRGIKKIPRYRFSVIKAV